MLGDAEASEKAAAQKATVAEVEARISGARERLGITQEAVRMLERRGVDLQADIRREVQAAADAAQLEVVGHIGRQLRELQPALEMARELRLTFACGTNWAMQPFDDPKAPIDCNRRVRPMTLSIAFVAASEC